MFTINHAYQIKINQSFFSALTRVTGTRRLVVSKSLVVTYFGKLPNTLTNIKYIDIVVGENVGEATFTFTDTNDVTTIIRETDFVTVRDTLLFTFLFQNESGELLVPELDVIAEEVYTGTHGVLNLQNSGAILTYDEVDYTDEDTEVPLSIDNDSFKITANDGYILFKPNVSINVAFYKRTTPLRVYTADITSLINFTYFDDRIEFTVPFIMPLNESDIPYTRLNIALREASESFNIIADSLDNYQINEINTGVIEEVNIGENSSNLVVATPDNSDYHFTNESINVFEKMIEEANVCNSYDIGYDELTGYIEIVLKGMFDNFTFENLSTEALKLALNPYVELGTFTHVTTTFTPQRVNYGSQVEIPLSVDVGYHITNIRVINSNGYNVEYRYENGTLSFRANDDVTVTVTAVLNYELRIMYGNQLVTSIDVGKPIIDGILFSLVNNVYTLKFNITESVTLSIVVPANRKIIGLGSTKVLIPLNVKLNQFDLRKVAESEDVVILNVIDKDTTEVTDFTLNLFKLNGEKNQVDKSGIITAVGTSTGTLKESCSIMNPIITMEYTGVPNFNYIHIPNFHRYYFVNEVVSLNKDLWQLSLHVDVLMSYKDEIRANYGIIARNENDYNNLVEDNERLREKDSDIEVIELKNIFNKTTLSDKIEIIVAQVIAGV